MSKDVKIIYAGDWEVLFVDGEQKAQGHSISIGDLADALGFQIEQFAVSNEGDKLLKVEGEFDYNLNYDQTTEKYCI